MVYFYVPAFAHHEAINPINEKPNGGFYVEGEDIKTRILISTGNIGSDHEITSDNETIYYLTIRDIYENKPDISPEPYKATLFIKPLQIVNHNYTRQLLEGLWTVNVEVKTSSSTGQQELLLNSTQSILVKGAEFRVIVRQAEAAAQSAQIAQDAARNGPYVSAAAAILGAGVAAGGTFAVHQSLDKRREKREIQRENEVRNSVQSLIRLELTAYRDFINKVIETNFTKGPNNEVLAIKQDNKDLREYADRILPLPERVADPRNYYGLSLETKARSFSSDQITVLDKLYSELQGFRTRNRNPGGDDYEFDRDNITGLRNRINNAIDILGNHNTNTHSNSTSDRSPKSIEMLYQFKLSIFGVRAGFLFAISLSLLFLGWGGIISEILTFGTLDPVNPPANAWPILDSIGKYLLAIGIAGIVVMAAAVLFFILEGRNLKKEADSF